MSLGQIAVVGQGWVIPAGSDGITLDETTCGDNFRDFVSAILLPSGSVNLAAPADTDVTADSGNLANAAGTATLPGVAGQTTYISGFAVTGDGATVGSIVTVTITGLITGTIGYALTVPAGVLNGITPLIIEFARPIPASALNTAIVVNLPALGAGSTNARVNAHGFQRLASGAAAASPANVGVLDVLDCVCAGTTEFRAADRVPPYHGVTNG